VKRIYVLEGPDGCGKSVLATDLVDRLKPALLTRHGPYPGDKEVWRRYLVSMLPAYTGLADVVLDRSWLSEPIYGAAYRGGANRILPWQRRMLERVALGRGAMTILCRVPWQACRENFRRRKAEGGEMLDDAKQLRAVYDGYAKLERALADGPMLEYDFNATSSDSLLRALDGPRAPLENLGPGIGAWNPGKSILLVGERPGGFGGRWHLPFVSLRADGCSAWLAEQLEKAGVPEAALYWVNARDGDEKRGERRLNVPYLRDQLRPKAIFALGDVAAAWLKFFGVKGYVAVAHPQAHKRFHSKQLYPLIQELQACLKISRR
jgi:thymidylate kinase